MVFSIVEARKLGAGNNSWLLMGKDGGRKIAGFDFSNSPAELANAEVEGRTLVQRTTSGTQGVVNAINASTVYCASLVCASATARQLRSCDEVSYVITGTAPDGSLADEDVAGAELIELLRTQSPSFDPYVQRVRNSPAAVDLSMDGTKAHPDDVSVACEVNKFDFAIRAEKVDGLIIAETVD